MHQSIFAWTTTSQRKQLMSPVIAYLKLVMMTQFISKQWQQIKFCTTNHTVYKQSFTQTIIYTAIFIVCTFPFHIIQVTQIMRLIFVWWAFKQKSQVELLNRDFRSEHRQRLSVLIMYIIINSQLFSRFQISIKLVIECV